MRQRMSEPDQRRIAMDDLIERAHRQADVARRRQRGDAIAEARGIRVDRIPDVLAAKAQQRVCCDRGIGHTSRWCHWSACERVQRHRSHRLVSLMLCTSIGCDRRAGDH